MRNSTARWKELADAPTANPSVILLFHIEKTGGSAVMKWLKRQLHPPARLTAVFSYTQSSCFFGLHADLFPQMAPRWREKQCGGATPPDWRRSRLAFEFHSYSKGFFARDVLPALGALRRRYAAANGTILTVTSIREPASHILSKYRMWPPRTAGRKHVVPLPDWLASGGAGGLQLNALLSEREARADCGDQARARARLGGFDVVGVTRCMRALLAGIEARLGLPHDFARTNAALGAYVRPQGWRGNLGREASVWTADRLNATGRAHLGAATACDAALYADALRLQPPPPLDMPADVAANGTCSAAALAAGGARPSAAPLAADESASAAGGGGAAARRRALNLSAPLLLHEESAAALCAHRPPFGLLAEKSTLDGHLKGLGLRSEAAEAAGTAPRGGAAARSRAAASARTAACTTLAARYVHDAPVVGGGGGRSAAAAAAAAGRCAVVGSGGTLIGSGAGAAIDAHDVVFRFNLAPTGGQWAADVGTRTTHRLFNGQSRARAPRVNASGAAHLLYCPFDRWVGKCLLSGVRWLPKGPRGPEALAAHPRGTGGWLMVNPVFSLQTAEQQWAHGGRHGRMASTGLLGVAMAAAMCERVTLFGFGNDSDAGTSAACGHYWECSRNQSRYFGGKSGYHDWHAQWRVLSDWVATGVVSYFERRPGTS